MDTIRHHGIEGQKWGVRRFQNPDGSLTKQGKARAKGLRIKAKLTEQYLGKHYDKKQLDFDNRSEDEDYTINKGSTVTHITPLEFKSLRSNQDLYVSGTEFDKKMYRTFLSLKLKSKGFTKPIHEVEFEVQRDLRAPSNSRQKKIFKELFDSHKQEITRDLSDYYKCQKNYESSSDAYADFIKSLDKPSQSKHEFYSKLKEQSYDAVLDVHDIENTWIQTKKPLLLMDAAAVLGNMKVSEIHIDTIQKTLDELLKHNY